ncbi:TPA: cation tolerance protein CutA, partial [Candidatus Latescibacteria bacterium]|nr:cation tolerance protein CutA [Candidatus Latescibacterota bacterium]
MSEQDIRLVYITTSSEEEGARIASAVVEERLAACGNIVPRIR